MEYIAGVRMRTVWDVREIVLENKDPFETVTENLKVKRVYSLGNHLYLVSWANDFHCPRFPPGCSFRVTAGQTMPQTGGFA